MSDTPRTDELAQGWDEGLAMPSQMLTLARQLERENAALRAELEAEAVVNGKGGEREAKLLAEVAALRKDRERIKFLMTVAGSAWAYRFLRDHQTLDRNEIDFARKEAQS